jgi:5-methyltetrahydrofolate--homocysteine methyltransferase
MRQQVRVMIGGAPISQEYADQIGADGYAPSAVQAVGEAKRLLGIQD